MRRELKAIILLISTILVVAGLVYLIETHNAIITTIFSILMCVGVLYGLYRVSLSLVDALWSKDLPR